MTGLDEAVRAAASSIPSWITDSFAIGTFAGLLGGLGLLVLEGWIIFFSDAQEAFGLAVPVMVSAGVILLAYLATHARGRGWLS